MAATPLSAEPSLQPSVFPFLSFFLQFPVFSCLLVCDVFPMMGWKLYLYLVPSCSVPELSTTHLQSSVSSRTCRELGRACWRLHTTFNSKSQRLDRVYNFLTLPLMSPQPPPCTARLLNVELLSAGEICSSSWKDRTTPAVPHPLHTCRAFLQAWCRPDSCLLLAHGISPHHVSLALKQRGPWRL